MSADTIAHSPLWEEFEAYLYPQLIDKAACFLQKQNIPITDKLWHDLQLLGTSEAGITYAEVAVLGFKNVSNILAITHATRAAYELACWLEEETGIFPAEGSKERIDTLPPEGHYMTYGLDTPANDFPSIRITFSIWNLEKMRDAAREYFTSFSVEEGLKNQGFHNEQEVSDLPVGPAERCGRSA